MAGPLADGSRAATPDGGLPPFTEEAVARGILYVPAQAVPFGEGLAMADLDGDGDPDIVVLGAATARIGVYENDGSGHFIDRSIGIAGQHPLCSGVTAVDVDRDGDLDLHVTRRGMPDRLFVNEGAFTFTERAAFVGIAHDGDGHGAAWADVNGDGWLDLYLCDRDGPNALYMSQPPGPGEDILFVDEGEDRGVAAGSAPSFAAGFLDMDADGDADLYLANDHGTNCGIFQNHLFRNDGHGVFTDVTDEGTEGCLDAMCVAIGDFDGDGRQDLFSTNTPAGHALMLNGGTRPWMRAEKEAGVAGYAVGWGASFLDYDHDGRLDLYVCHANAGNRLFRNTPDWPTEDVSVAMGMDDDAQSYACAAGDVDGDGDLDLLVHARNEPVRLYMNQTGQMRRWIKLDVVGLGAPPAVTGRAPAPAIGTLVRVETASASRIREVRAGTGFKSQDDMRVHVGIDADPDADIHVQWPGLADARVLRNHGANRTWTIWPTERLGDMDHDGVRDAADLSLLAECWTGDDPGALLPGCELADLDGDADVDAEDVMSLLESGYLGWTGDCDGDGVIDAIAIASGAVADADGDGVPDDCPGTPTLPEDLDGDGRVDGADVQLLFGSWGAADKAMDLDGDGLVAMGDLLMVLAAWTE